MAYPKRTHCKNGHEFTSENTYQYSDKRKCRQCTLDRQSTPEALNARASRAKDGRYNHYALKRHRDRKQFIQEVVGTVCVDCGEDRPAAIQYHHPNGAQRRYSYKHRGNPARPLVTLSWEDLKEEVMYVIALCANCHTIRHREAA